MRSKLKRITAMIVAVVMVFLVVPMMPQAGTVYADGSLQDGTYSADGLRNVNLSMYHFRDPQVVIKGDDAWLITTSSDSGTTNRYDGMAYGPMSQILDPVDETHHTLVAGTPTARVVPVYGEDGETLEARTFVLPVPKSVLEARGDIYYMIKYKAGYSASHDGDWYVTSSGDDYYFTGYELSLISDSTVLPGDEAPAPASTDLTITNISGMFKAVTASLETQDGNMTLVVALSSDGYHYLYKGTYEEAVANGNATENWIAGHVNDANKWEFSIPIESSELGKAIPITAVSQKYYDYYLQGQNPIARAFFPRQMTVDKNAGTLVTDDYNKTEALTITNNADGFALSSASLYSVGGPNSNNYASQIILTMGSEAFTKAYIGTAQEAADADETIALGNDKTFALKVKWIVTAGNPESVVNLMEGPFTVSFYSAESGGWEELAFTADEGAKTLKIDAAEEAPERQDLTITNISGMFKAVTASLETQDGQMTLVVALSSDGYHYLYKGTYEEAVANGSATENWIAGHVNSANKWEFRIPIESSELGKAIPITAVSQKYYESYLEDKNPIARAFYPRQMAVDKEAGTLVTDDYNKTETLTVTNQVSMFSVSGAVLHSVGGPNSNNYASEIILTMGSDSFDKAFIGTQTEAEAASKTVSIGTDRLCTLKYRWIETAGDPDTVQDLSKDPITVSFYSVRKKIWYERILTLDESGLTLLITDSPKADYTAVNAAKEAAEAIDRELYTDESLAALDAALDAVVEGRYASAQDQVDAMAAAINSALSGLKEKTLKYSFDKSTSNKWVIGSGKDFSFTVHRNMHDETTFSHFTGIKIDGKALTEEEFTAESGSLKGTVKADYLETLSEGDHTLTVNFDDAEAGATLKIKVMKKEAPDTGDNIVRYYIAIAAAVIVLAAMYVENRRYHE